METSSGPVSAAVIYAEIWEEAKTAAAKYYDQPRVLPIHLPTHHALSPGERAVDAAWERNR